MSASKIIHIKVSQKVLFTYSENTEQEGNYTEQSNFSQAN